MLRLLRSIGRTLRRTAALGAVLALAVAVVAGLADLGPGSRVRVEALAVQLDPDRGLLAFDPDPGAGLEGPVHASPAGPDQGPPVDTLGDDPELDALWLACEAGSGLACDRLFRLAPIGSGYERFGLSCGERAQVLDCQVELDGIDHGPVVDGWPLPFPIGS